MDEEVAEEESQKRDLPLQSIPWSKRSEHIARHISFDMVGICHRNDIFDHTHVRKIDSSRIVFHKYACPRRRHNL
jgi:hypothetical protein